MTKEEKLKYIDEKIASQGNEGALAIAPLLRELVEDGGGGEGEMSNENVIMYITFPHADCEQSGDLRGEYYSAKIEEGDYYNFRNAFDAAERGLLKLRVEVSNLRLDLRHVPRYMYTEREIVFTNFGVDVNPGILEFYGTAIFEDIVYTILISANGECTLYVAKSKCNEVAEYLSVSTPEIMQTPQEQSLSDDVYNAFYTMDYNSNVVLKLEEAVIPSKKKNGSWRYLSSISLSNWVREGDIIFSAILVDFYIIRVSVDLQKKTLSYFVDETLDKIVNP